MKVLICGTNNYDALIEMIDEIKSFGFDIHFLDFENKLSTNHYEQQIKNSVDSYHWIENGLQYSFLSSEINSLHQKYQFDYGITTLTYIIEPFAKICRDEGIRFTGFDSIKLLKNKYLIQNNLCRAGFPFIKSMVFSSNVKIENLNFPVIVKPVVGACSINVKKINSLDEIISFKETFKSLSSDLVANEYVIEEFKEGNLVSCEALIVKR